LGTKNAPPSREKEYEKNRGGGTATGWCLGVKTKNNPKGNGLKKNLLKGGKGCQKNHSGKGSEDTYVTKPNLLRGAKKKNLIGGILSGKGGKGVGRNRWR